MIRLVVIEDEAVALRRILTLLEKSPVPVRVVKTLDSVRESAEYLQHTDEYDLILQDIHLSDGNSLEMYKVNDFSKPVLFITAYDEYALQAFKQWSVDYLLKPLKKDELYQALEKFRLHFSDRQTLEDEERHYLIKVGNHLKTVDKKEVAYYFSAAKITYVVTFDDKKYPLDDTLEQIESEVPSSFFRVNRQYIVHRESIHKIHTHTKSRLKLTLSGNKEEIVISTEKTPLFKEWLKG